LHLRTVARTFKFTFTRFLVQMSGVFSPLFVP